MRLAVLLLCLSPILAAQPVATRQFQQAPGAPTPPEDLGKLSGRVVSSVTGEPVRRASIVLMRADATPGEPSFSYTSVSNAEGQFALPDIEPGRYRLTATRNGFVAFTYGTSLPMRTGAPLTLARRQSLTGVTLKMTPQGIVAGRIVDDDGEPLANASISLQSYRYVQGRKQLMATGASFNTNDLGEYRAFGIAPGKYFLAVSLPNRTPIFALDRSGGTDESYVTTYYPGAIDIASATPLQIPAGGQLRGIDMVLSKTRTYHVKGHVSHGMSGRPNVSMVQVLARGGGFPSIARTIPVDAAGNFDISGLVPGGYTLIAVFNDSTGARRARMSVEVARGNVEGLSLTALPDVSVQGSAVSDPDSPPVILSGVRLSVQQRESDAFSGSSTVRLDGQGAFELRNIQADRYYMVFAGLPSGAYVKSARTDRNDVLVSGLDLTSGAAGVLTVVISPRGAAVSGVVQKDNNGAPANDATVALIPQETERRGQPYFYRSVSADHLGAFSFTGVPPGEYKLYAWEDIDSDAYLDPDFVKPFESKGESITLRESDRKTVPLKLIPADN